MRDHHGESFHYEVIARRPEPSFGVSLAGANPTINRAGGKAFTITANRLDGFNGPITLEISNMPAGFTVTTPLTIQAGHLQARGVVHAHANAVMPEGNMWGQIQATAMVAGRELVMTGGMLGELKLSAPSKVVAHMTPVTKEERPSTEFWDRSQREFSPLTPKDWLTDGATVLKVQEDKSLLAEGPNPENETYTVKYDLPQGMLHALRLDVLGDSSLPTGAPGAIRKMEILSSMRSNSIW